MVQLTIIIVVLVKKNANILAKLQANWTCRNHETFEPQIAVRLYEHIVLDGTMRCFLPIDFCHPVNEDCSIGETKFTIYFQEDPAAMEHLGLDWFVVVEGNKPCAGDLPKRRYKKKKKNRKSRRRKRQMDLLDARVKRFLYDELEPFVEQKVNCFTMTKRRGCIFRAHPSYRSGKEWFDWANIMWELQHDDGTTTAQIIPGQIQCFVDLTDISTDSGVCGLDQWEREIVKDPPVEPGIYVVVNSLHGPTTPIPGSDFMLSGNREVDIDGNMKFSFVDVENIHSPTFCFPYFGNEDEAEVYQLTPCEEWYKYF